jgi:hypothetical protein
VLGGHCGREAELPGGRREASRRGSTGEHLHSRNAIEHGYFSLWLKTESPGAHIIVSQVKLYIAAYLDRWRPRERQCRTNFWVDPAAGISVVALPNTAVAGMTGDFPMALRRAVYQEMQ